MGLNEVEAGVRQAGDAGTGRPANAKVAYFVDVFAGYNDPLIGEATVAVLRHNGIEVYVPPRQVGCGMAALAVGDVETAREAACETSARWPTSCAKGYRIVCSEPTAALMLSQDYLDLLDDPDTASVAAQHGRTDDVPQRTARRRPASHRLPAGWISTLGHHVPCHLKALRGPAAGPRLLSLDSGIAGSHHRRGLFGHGRHLGAEGREPRNLARGRRGDVRGAQPAGRAVRLDRVQHLPDADAGGDREAHAAPGAIPRLCLRPDAGDRRQAEEAAWELGERLMTPDRHTLRRGPRTRRRRVDRGRTAPRRDRRRSARGLARRVPALAGLLAKSALAVNHDFADDAQVLQPTDEVAVIPPVSGG